MQGLQGTYANESIKNDLHRAAYIATPFTVIKYVFITSIQRDSHIYANQARIYEGLPYCYIQMYVFYKMHYL